ncbi:MAG: TfoX/Sxy family protein [Rhodospirillaceae bacterium]|nr:TfoX/Sxy family protein [Rhodospirillaceae bacterium]
MSLQLARAQAEEIAERIAGLGPVAVTRFFSGAGLVLEGVQFAFVIAGSLYLKVDDETRPQFEAAGAAPFSYSGPKKQVVVTSYYETPASVLEEDDTLTAWAADAVGAARRTQAKKPKRARQPKAAKSS